MKIFNLIIGLSVLLFASSCSEENNHSSGDSKGFLKNYIDSVSYAVGVQIGNDFKSKNYQNNFEEVDLEAFYKGVQNGMDSSENAISDDEIFNLLRKFDREKEEAYQLKNEAFYNSYLGKEGYIESKSGLIYKVISKGDQPVAKMNEIIQASYIAKFIDGTAFDSSKRTNDFFYFTPESTSLKGLREVAVTVPVGSKVELIIPYYLGFGDKKTGPVPGYSTLVYEVELHKIITEEEIEQKYGQQ